MKRFLAFFIIVIMSTFFGGCSQKEKNTEETIQDAFDYEKGQKIADQYIENLAKGQFQLLEDLSTPDLSNSNKLITEKGEKIISYKKMDTKETGKSMYYRYRVNRCKEGSPRTDLDDVIIQVERSENGYLVSDVTASTEIEVFSTASSLRVKYKDEVRNYLLLRINNLPKETYPKINKAPIYKETIPTEEFGSINLAYEGKKIAITSKDKTKTFIGIVEIDSEEKKKSTADTGNSEMTEQLELLERPIGKKIIPLDLIYDKNVEQLIFSKDEDSLVVQYSEANKGKGINIYKSSSGELQDVRLEDMFPREKYNVLINKLNEKDLYIKITPLEGVKGIREDVIGEYSINLKDLNITKL